MSELVKRLCYLKILVILYHIINQKRLGLLSGSVAGVEQDEQGNITLDPQKFLLGLAGGAAGSKAIAQGFKTMNKNPELKAKVTKELANTLSKGWNSAVKQYPILESLQPRYIVKNEKGREIQAKNMLESLAKTQRQKVEIEIPKGQDFRALKQESEAYLQSLKDTIITNKETGIQATIARKGTKEMISNVKKSVANGFNFREHFAVANHLKEVFENATFAKKLSDTKHNDPRVSIYRFNSAVVLNGKEANALITLKEYLENGKRLYALELEELSKAKFIP